MTTNYYSGIGGSIVVSSTTLCVTSWSGQIDCDALDVSNTCGSGWDEIIKGFCRAKVTAKGFYTGAPPAVEGALGACTFHLGSSASSITGTFMVKSVNYDVDVKQPVTWTMELMSSGAVLGPS